MGPMPAWARRRKEAREAEDARRWQARVRTLIGDLLPVDAVWSNTSRQAFCVACRRFAPGSVIELALEASTPCAHCGEAVGAVAARKAG